MKLRATLATIADTAGFFLVLSVLMLAIGDQFPFSHFPMYSVLPESAMSIRVVDEAGQRVPVQIAFSVQSSILKKQMIRELNEQKAKGKIKLVSAPSLEVSKECGQRVLDWMLQNRPARDPAMVGKKVKLEQVVFTAKKGSVTEKVDVLAEGIVPEPKAKPQS